MSQPAERSAISQINPSVPAEPEIRAQLARILSSPHFAAAEGARKLLSYLVMHTLAGETDQIKEYTLAVEVFGRDESFDPKINPSVRVEAGRLRRRLEHYYLTQGTRDPVLIELPRGGYTPRFCANADVLHLAEDLAQAAANRQKDSDEPDLTMPGGPTICVRPFANLGGEADAPFADGISIEILTALARFRQFRVLGRGTVFGHRGEQDAKRLCAELGADYVLGGSIRREAQTVRVNAELLSAEDGKVVWAERYERELTADAMFAVEDEISTLVVATVAQPFGVIARPEAAVARRKVPGRLHAYDCLMLFYDYTAHRSEERHAELRDLLEAESKLSPDVATLWAALSFLHTDTWRFGYNPAPSREVARDLALEAANRAVELDPHDALGYHARFQAHFAHGDIKAFKEAGNRAVELNPNHTDILADYGLHLTMCDEWDRGRLLLKLALSLNPEPPDWYWFPFFVWHFERGEYDDALEMALRSQNQAFYWTHGMHALAYSALGMRDEAAAAIGRLLECNPDFSRHAREELGLWMNANRLEQMLAALHEAGLPKARAAG
jgi:TolB-like protein/tetratricopeptide (TPR) repeat protein